MHEYSFSIVKQQAGATSSLTFAIILPDTR